jgi:glycine C-acetyltransferase
MKESRQIQRREPAEIRAWLADWIARRRGRASGSIDLDLPFEAHGLDSLDAATLSGELEDWLGCSLPPHVAQELASLEELVIHLAERTNPDAVPARPGSAEAAYAGGESFDLHLFVSGGERLPLQERVARFQARFAALPPEQRLSYRRVVTSPADREVEVIDPRTGAPRRMLMFGSNNYLGLANHPYVRAAVAAAIDRFGVGLGGPPLLNGTTRLHQELEERLSALKHAEATALFASGYGANVGLVTALADPRQDAVIFDEYSHASLVDAVRMAGLRPMTFPHNDVDALAAALTDPGTRRGDTFVGVEGVYSMDGDLAPLDRIVPLCRQHGAFLVLDDAHGTGVLGEGGSGAASHFGVAGQVDITMGTFSKAFGMAGGFVSASRPLVEYLRFFARSYMFSASLPPVVVAAVLAGLDVLEREPERIERLRGNVRYAAAALARLGLRLAPEAAILTLRAPRGMDVRRAAARFHEAGIFLNSVEYPAVPRDEQRLRISLMASHTRGDIDRLVGRIEEIWLHGEEGAP